MADLLSHPMEIYPGDVIFNPKFKIMKQFDRYSYASPDRHHRHEFVERCQKKNEEFEIFYCNKQIQIAVKIYLLTIDDPTATRQRAKIQLNQNFKDYFTAELAKFCACHHEDLARRCQKSSSSTRIQNFLLTFMTDTALYAGFELRKIECRLLSEAAT